LAKKSPSYWNVVDRQRLNGITFPLSRKVSIPSSATVRWNSRLETRKERRLGTAVLADIRATWLQRDKRGAFDPLRVIAVKTRPTVTPSDFGVYH
jgi:hypothetical protein